MGLEQQAVPGVAQFEQNATLDSPVAVPGWSAEVTREAIHIWEHTRAPGPSPRNSLIISPPGIR